MIFCQSVSILCVISTPISDGDTQNLKYGAVRTIKHYPRTLMLLHPNKPPIETFTT